jgi:hypothetical protein
MIDMRKIRQTMLVLALGVAAAAGAQAQPYSPRSVIASGATSSAGGATILRGTLGQAGIGTATGSNMKAGLGFWYMMPLLAPGPDGVAEEMIAGTVATVRCSPNPFSRETMIAVAMPAQGRLTVMLYDQIGRRVRTVADKEHEAGTVTLRLESDGLESGRYLLGVQAGSVRATLPLLIVK